MAKEQLQRRLHHRGVLRHLLSEINAKSYIIITAIVFDVIVLGAFLWVKAQQDIIVIVVSLIMMVAIFVGERFFIQSKDRLKPIMNE
jgi:hypothetical protein